MTPFLQGFSEKRRERKGRERKGREGWAEFLIDFQEEVMQQATPKIRRTANRKHKRTDVYTYCNTQLIRVARNKQHRTTLICCTYLRKTTA